MNIQLMGIYNLNTFYGGQNPGITRGITRVNSVFVGKFNRLCIKWLTIMEFNPFSQSELISGFVQLPPGNS